MDSQTMVGEPLTNEMIASGEKLVQKLDEEGYSVDAALWFLLPDTETWKLVLSLSELAKEGPKAAYKAVQKTLSQLQELEIGLDDIVVVKPDSPLLRLMRTAVKTGPGISTIRFSRNVINGQLIDDALIYRLQ